MHLFWVLQVKNTEVIVDALVIRWYGVLLGILFLNFVSQDSYSKLVWLGSLWMIFLFDYVYVIKWVLVWVGRTVDSDECWNLVTRHYCIIIVESWVSTSWFLVWSFSSYWIFMIVLKKTNGFIVCLCCFSYSVWRQT